MTATARRLLLGAVALTALVHVGHLGRYFIRDELVALHRVSGWSFSDILGRTVRLVSGDVGDRPHVLGYLFVKLLWCLSGPWFPAYAAAALGVHLLATALVGVVASRLAPREEAIAPLAALLFGVWGATFDIGTFAVVQHLMLAVGAAGQVAAYAAFRSRPSLRSGTLVMALALFSAVSLESGPLAALGPVLFEVCLKLSPASNPDRAVASGRARTWLCVAALAVGVPRLWHEAGALLGGQLLDAAAPERYSVAFSPARLVENIAYLIAQTAAAPPWAALPLALFGAAGLLASRTRAAALFGISFGLVLAAPFCTMAATASFYALTPAVGWAITASASAVALRHAVPGSSHRFVRAGTAFGLVALVVLSMWGVQRRDAKDAAAFSALRAVRVGLMTAFPAGNTPVDLALYGVPTGSFHPDYPLMLQHALPVLLPGRRFHRVWVLAPAAEAPFDAGSVTFAARAPAELESEAAGLRSFAVRTGRLVECTGPDCTGPAGAR